jgi:hypothetical protein
MMTRNRSSRRSRWSSLLPTSLPLVAVLACAPIAAVGLGLTGCKSQSEPVDVADLPEAARAKLDPQLLRLMAQLSASGKGDSLVSVLVKLKSGMEEQNDLSKAGLQVESTIGEVVAGRAPASELPKIALVPDVVHIQPATTYRAGGTEQP